jgi:hypothetical protein
MLRFTVRVPTLILSRRYSVDSNALFRAALDAGWHVERLMSFEAPPSLAARDPVLYGEALFADALAAQLGLALVEPSGDWLCHIPDAYRSRNVRQATLAEARALSEPAFVKPADEKCFPARVYAGGDELTDDPGLDQSLRVLIADPVTFTFEHRAFVVERRIAALCPYLRNGELARDDQGDWPALPHELDEPRELLTRLLGDPAVLVPPAAVIDVGHIAGVGPAVVEANPAWASGLCGCDPRDVLPVLRRASVRADEVTNEDRQWLRASPR